MKQMEMGDGDGDIDARPAVLPVPLLSLYSLP